MKNSDIKLKKWIHPSTGQVRIYINSEKWIWGDEKMWFEEQDNQFQSATIKRSGPYDSSKNMRIDKIDMELRALGLNTDNWSEVISHAA